MAPRQRCKTCGSKQWHKEPLSGIIACSEGHVLQNYRSETTEITEVGPHAMKKRALKKGKVGEGRKSRADPKLYHGARGRYHFFLCLQLILRKQIVALSKLWDLPPEFEIVCRDIWALHLALLPEPPSAEEYHDGPEEGETIVNEVNEIRASGKTDNGSASRGDIEGDVDQEEEGERDASEDEDSELEELMRENSDVSSSSDDEGDLATTTLTPKKRKKGNAGYEGILSTVGVLVVGCWTLRIPVMYRDFTRIIESYELPYLDAWMKLPGSMAEHLTKHNVQALCPPHGPRTMAIHKVASRLAKKLQGEYKIDTPEANGASILWRITKEMGGTPVGYRMAKRIASVLSVPLRLQRDEGPAEVGLLACVIIMLKMVYGLDGNDREAEDEGDPSCGLACKTDYLRVIREMHEGHLKRLSSRIDSRNGLRVAELDGPELDRYLAFCERLLGQTAGEIGCDDEEESQYPRGREKAAGLGRGMAAGSAYKIGITEEGATVLERGQAVVGVSVAYLSRIVERYERMMSSAIADIK